MDSISVVISTCRQAEKLYSAPLVRIIMLKPEKCFATSTGGGIAIPDIPPSPWE